MPKPYDLTGLRFGRLVALELCGKGASGARWRCRCDCGGLSEAQASNLKSGQVRSCGCLLKETAGEHSRTHGEGGAYTASAEHRVWTGMLARCRNPNQKSYPDYGGRGIVVCERWLKYENFLADMGRRPTAKHEIDRKDSNGNYEPGNCHWATRIQQARNKRTTLRIEFEGIVMSAPEWAEVTGLKLATIRKRLHDGWGASDTLSFPVGVNNHGRTFSPPPDPDKINKLAADFLRQRGESVESTEAA